MHENSRVPPSRRSPEEADRPGDQAPAASPALDEPRPETAASGGRNEAAGDEPAGLPRRVRGTTGRRPPVQVDRPAFSEAMLQRVQAAVAAAADDEPDEGAPPREPTGQVDLFGPAAASEPATDSPAERAGGPAPEMAEPPIRPLGTNGDSKPPEKTGTPFLLSKSPTPDGAPAETTQPIPAVVRGLSRKGLSIDPPAGQEMESAAGPVKPAAAAETKPAARRSPALPMVHGGQPAKPKVARKAPERGARKAGSGRGYRVAGLLAVVLAAMGAGAYAFVHYGDRPGASAAISSADLPLVTRNSAAEWVAGQVATADVVACDPVMCAALEKHGMTAARLRVLWPGSDSMAGATVVVATPTVQSHLGARLDTVDAPGIIASFGTGNRRILIRVMAPRGAAAYRSALAADLAERKSSGQVLVSKSAIHWSAAERKQLEAGRVDVRLIVAIVDLAAKHPVQVVAFGDASPGAPSAPLRSAELAYAGTAAKKTLQAALIAQAAGNPEYRPAHIATVRLRTGQTVLQVEFSAPSPLGLLGGS